ncbi:MAG: hypothetical protein V7754_00810 [Halioglobus sp.]
MRVVDKLYPAIHHYRMHIIVFFTQFALLYLLYGQTRGFEYVYFDDADYILRNAFVLSGLSLENIQTAFTSFYMHNWHPLTWLSHMIDVSLFGTDPGWAHIHNVLLHGLVSLLVYTYLLRLSEDHWKSFILSLVFLVHPLHVESVAWIAERKDLLCAVFFMLGMILYDSYRTSPSIRGYCYVLLAFGLALLSKPMAVTFPVILLVMDVSWYQFRNNPNLPRLRSGAAAYARLVFEKLPLFALSAGMGIVTIIAQDRGGAVVDLEVIPFTIRLFNSVYAYTTYLKQMLMPIDLSAFYPYTGIPSIPKLIFPGLLLFLWLALAVGKIRQAPLIAAGLCWYIVSLLPVIGLIQVGSQAHADRYMYLPSVGVLMSAVYLLPNKMSQHFRLGSALSFIAIIYLSFICYWQIGYWENRYTLFSRVLEIVGPNWRAHIALATDYSKRGMWDKAIEHSEAARQLQPNMPESHQSFGDIAMARGDYKKAERIYLQAINAGHNSSGMFNNFGYALLKQGKVKPALEVFEIALGLDPHSIQAKRNIERIHSSMSGADQ